MANPPALRAIGNDSSSDQPDRKAFLKQRGEPQLWYNRFRRYCKLGPQRTLQAALLKEREAIKRVPEPVQDEPTMRKKKLSIVKPRVPGSWCQASVKWRWVERARLYDQHIVELAIDDYVDRIYDRLACREHRVWEMNNIIDELIATFRRTSDVQEKCALAARIQSMMGAIKDEMSDIDEQVSKYVLERGIKRRMKRSEHLEHTTVEELTEYGFAATFDTDKMGWMR